MRNYPLNSPQAAARLVTLAMLSDGHLSRAELNALERLGIDQQLGLSPAAMHEVVQAFCEDMLATAASVFAQTYRWSNFVYAAQHDFRSAKDSTAARQRLAGMAIDGVPLLPTQDPSAQAAVERLLAQVAARHAALPSVAARRAGAASPAPERLTAEPAILR